MKPVLRVILAAALALTCTAGIIAQPKPDFTGTWKTDTSFNSWTIAVEGSRMTVTMTVAGNSDSTVYLLDGTPSTKKIEGPQGMIDMVYTSAWEGDVLVTTITAPTMTRIERHSLEADGRMKVQTSLTMLQGKPAPPPPPGAEAPVFLTRVK